MRAVVQRVSRAEVLVNGKSIGSIGKGLLILLGVARGDTEKDAEYMVGKIAGLRIFEDAEGKMNLSLGEVGGEALVVSQFTLLADARKGRRPSFDEAAPAEEARRLYEHFIQKLDAAGVRVATGEFQAMMCVSLVNEGPVTILLDSRKLF